MLVTFLDDYMIQLLRQKAELKGCSIEDTLYQTLIDALETTDTPERDSLQDDVQRDLDMSA
jgi:plasmid stability protein